jgi:hypothetical protein
VTISTKTRRTVLTSSNYHWGQRNIQFPIFDQDLYSNDNEIVSTQVTTSEGHPYHFIGKTDGDIGGEFFSSRGSHEHNCPYLEVWSGAPANSAFFRGRLFPKFRQISSIEEFLDCSHSSIAEIDAAGSVAISRVLPTNPVAGLAVTLGELREGFPKMLGSSLFQKGKPLAKAGSEYLNWEFVWKPLISDFKKWLYAYRKADALWDQFVRDAGRRVRRRYHFPKTTEVLSSNVTLAQPAGVGHINSAFWPGNPTIRYPLFSETILERNRWFSGSFTYYLDDDPSERGEWKRHTRRLQHLYGTKITPEVVWNLSPWSWAADWLGNAGNVITNVSRFAEDGLVMPYGYMMELSVIQHTYRMRDVKPKGYSIPDLTQTLRHTVKYRRRATPYGFGLDEGSFTPRQWAIIVALGLSRSR